MQKHFPGSLFQRGKRWWWSVRKPGESDYSSIPLRPSGARYATTDRGVAAEIAEGMWRQWVFADTTAAAPTKIVTMGDLCSAYMDYCRDYYSENNEWKNIQYALKHVVSTACATPIEEFGPRALKAVREAMIDDDLSRKLINRRINIVRRMVRWAVEEELASMSLYHGLQAVRGLRQGRCRAREMPPVRPVAVNHVDLTAQYVPRMIADMIFVQRLIGCRPGELCAMRVCELEQLGDLMLFRPEQHKTKWRGHKKVYAVGPRACEVLHRRISGLGPFDHVFSPRRSEEERRQELHSLRKTPLNYGNSPGTNRADRPKVSPGEAYSTNEYARAIRRGIAAARKDGHDVPNWSPNRLRHSRGTEVRKLYDAEHARTVLGHRQLSTTEIYAENDLEKALKVARETG